METSRPIQVIACDDGGQWGRGLGCATCASFQSKPGEPDEACRSALKSGEAKVGTSNATRHPAENLDGGANPRPVPMLPEREDDDPSLKKNPKSK